MQYQFHHAIVGGTFDRFHAGHRKLLTTAFEQSEKVIIGIATDELFHNKRFVHLIEEYNVREQSVSNFLQKNNFADRSEIISIHDIYGNSLEDQNINTIFVTESTKANALKINEERKKKSFKPLEIITVPFVLGNDNEVISSERIRMGQIDREGNSYAKLFTTQAQFDLSENEKEAFRDPIGSVATDMKEVIASLDSRNMLIAVGDIVATSAAKVGRLAAISVTDGKTRRHIVEPDLGESFAKIKKRQTHNPAGTITQEAVTALQAAITDYQTNHTEQLIAVSGEEDLLAIPAILLAPLQTVVLYGQFGKGIVVVKVSEQNKKRVYDLFGKFK